MCFLHTSSFYCEENISEAVFKNGRCRVLWRDLRCQGLDQQGPQGLGSFSDQGPKWNIYWSQKWAGKYNAYIVDNFHKGVVQNYKTMAKSISQIYAHIFCICNSNIFLFLPKVFIRNTDIGCWRGVLNWEILN